MFTALQCSRLSPEFNRLGGEIRLATPSPIRRNTLWCQERAGFATNRTGLGHKQLSKAQLVSKIKLEVNPAVVRLRKERPPLHDDLIVLQAAGQVAAAPLGQKRAPRWRQQGGQRQPPIGEALRQQQRGLHLRVAPHLLHDSRANVSYLSMPLLAYQLCTYLAGVMTCSANPGAEAKQKHNPVTVHPPTTEGGCRRSFQHTEKPQCAAVMLDNRHDVLRRQK